MTTPRDTTSKQQAHAADARDAARRAAFALARDHGADLTTRPPHNGASTSIRDVEPLAGLAAARQLELAARRTARDYLRAAREAGRTWHQIGTALGLASDAQHDGGTIADAAHAYAAGPPDPGAP